MAEPARPLRFGIMCNGLTFPRWQAECIRSLLASDIAAPALLIRNPGGDTTRPRRSVLKRLRSRRLWWNLFQRVFVGHSARSMVPVDLSAELAAVPAISCKGQSRPGRIGQVFDPADVERVRGAKLDFVLRFGFNILQGDILHAPRWGVWSFHHDDLDEFRGPPACFWPMFAGHPLQGVTLQRLTDGIDNGVILERAWLKCDHASYARNRDRAFLCGAHMPLKACRRIALGQTSLAEAAPSETTAAVRTIPTLPQVARAAVRSVVRSIADAADSRVRDDHWRLGVLRQPVHTVLAGSLSEPVWITPTATDRYFADPFVARRGSETLIAAEEYPAGTRVGRIAAITLDASLRPQAPAPVIEEPYHLSYPFLVERRGQLFCIPESANAKRVCVYEVGSSRQLWKKVATLFDGVALLDPTIFEHDGHWWMFACTRDVYTEARLEAFHAPDLFGPWRPHDLNPLKSDIRSGRPGGKPFVHNRELYRPAQDCSRTYGGSVALMRITRLTPSEFEEAPVLQLTPGSTWACPDGLHTLSWADDLTVIDAKSRIIKARAPAFGRAAARQTPLAAAHSTGVQAPSGS